MARKRPLQRRSTRVKHDIPLTPRATPDPFFSRLFTFYLPTFTFQLLPSNFFLLPSNFYLLPFLNSSARAKREKDFDPDPISSSSAQVREIAPLLSHFQGHGLHGCLLSKPRPRADGRSLFGDIPPVPTDNRLAQEARPPSSKRLRLLHHFLASTPQRSGPPAPSQERPFQRVSAQAPRRSTRVPQENRGQRPPIHRR